MQTFTFTQEEANQYGLHEAIILSQIRNFVLWAKHNNVHCYEGRHWTYNTVKKWAAHFGFMSEKQVRSAIDNLLKRGVIIKGDFAENRFIRPTFVTLNDECSLALEGNTSCPGGQHEISLEGNSTIALEGNSSIYYKSTKDLNIYNAQSPKDDVSKFDFESLYKKYPRKEGKSRGLKICKTQIKTTQDFTELDQAIDNYKEHCRLKIRDSSFIKHFSTFMAEWRDWLENEHLEIEEPTEEELKKRWGIE